MEDNLNEMVVVEESNAAENLNMPADNGNKKMKHRKKEQGFRDKLAMLWKDKRKFSVRLITAICAAIAFVFTFFVFGPFELYISNMSFFAFSCKYLIPPVVIAGLILTAAVTLILVLLRGKVYNYAVSLVFSVTLAGYIQGNFLNIDHGTLDGSEVVWQNFKVPAMLNLLFWAGSHFNSPCASVFQPKAVEECGEDCFGDHSRRTGNRAGIPSGYGKIYQCFGRRLFNEG